MSSGELGTFTRSRMWGFKRIATRYVDPILRPIVPKLPSFGVVTHRAEALALYLAELSSVKALRAAYSRGDLAAAAMRADVRALLADGERNEA